MPFATLIGESHGQKPIIRQAKTYLTKLSSGNSKPVVFETTDGKRWLVKYKNNPQGLRILVNEWVASNLAKLLGLTTPDCSLVILDEELLEIESIVVPGTTTKIQAGLSFGSNYIERANNNPTRYQMEHLDNAHTIPGIIVMDTWIDNPDRDDRDRNFSNIMVSPGPLRSRYTLYAIDFGKIGSSNWTANELVGKTNTLKLRGYNRLFRPLVIGKSAFQSFLNALELVPDETIESTISTVPNEWNLNHQEAIALINFLQQRKKLVRQVIESSFA
ncbi:MAG: hypothetical protein NTW48_09880 [Chloroflexi bacterium]|nr:hypothetical protein [Chloroflexota bacterium]